MIDIVAECSGAKTIGICGHIKPDGDCIGATLALSLYLKKRLPEAEITVFSDEISPCFSCVEGIRAFDFAFEKEQPEVFIAMVNYVVPTASSASELVYDLMDPAYIDREIAEAVYMGIAHDTGIFKFASTSPKTMRIVASLMEYGFDFPTLLDKTYYEKTYLQNLALGKILSDSKLHLDGKVISGSMDLKTMNEMGITGNPFEGVVSQLRITEGTECAIFMYQINAVTYKISLRSKQIVDVAKVAEHFGGGGHVRAAGFYCKGEADTILNEILELMKPYFD